MTLSRRRAHDVMVETNGTLSQFSLPLAGGVIYLTEQATRPSPQSTGRRKEFHATLPPVGGWKPMSANDKLVLQANFKDWEKEAGDLDGIDPWHYYCLDQFLKPYALDDDEIRYGITEGGNDGGADGLYFLVNQGQLITDDETTIDPKLVSRIRVIVFQTKHSGGMKPTEIEKWLPFTDDFFDLSRDPDDFGDRYNGEVKKVMQVWREQYIRMVQSHPEIVLDYYYITGDDNAPDAYALDSCERVKAAALKHVNATVNVNCVGAKELWEQVQKRPPKSRLIRWAETPMQTADGYVGLVRLGDYCKFLADESGEIAERIFESNVRGFHQDSTVNNGIAETLAEKDGPNFWLLNNGVTIIAGKTTPGGHRQLMIEDPQIVNGLQTSRVIFSRVGANSEDSRSVLVRVIETLNLATQDRIIRATNSQNKMVPASLRMTDQIHRDIEEFFKESGLYYDRRKGFYRDQGRPVRKIITPTYLVQAVVSILLQKPDDARARPGNYFKDDSRYKSVFANPKVPVSAYLICVQIMKRVEAYLASQNENPADFKNTKFYVAAMLARELSGIANPVAERLPAYAAKITDQALSEAYKRVRRTYLNLTKHRDADLVARGPDLLKRLRDQWNTRQSRNKKNKANGKK